MSECNISTGDDASNFVVHASSVKVSRYITVISDGEIVAEVDASIDFKQIPAKYHTSVANYLLMNPRVLVLASQRVPEVELSNPHQRAKKRWWQFW
jgi:hypothetical protein